MPRLIALALLFLLWLALCVCLPGRAQTAKVTGNEASKFANDFVEDDTGIYTSGVRIAGYRVQSDSCDYDEQCGQGMCRVYEHGRFVCEPKTHDVAVWDSDCIDKITMREDTKLEAPLTGSDNTTPDLTEASVSGVEVTLKPGCKPRIVAKTR